MAYPGIKPTRVRYNHYEKISVNWSQFGAPDGWTQQDGYGPDVYINFNAKSFLLINEGTAETNTVEYSFNGTTVHGELVPGTVTEGIAFDNRPVDLIWFRLKSGSTGPVTIRVEAWR